MIRPGRNPIYKLNKRTTKKINEGYLLNPHGRKYLYYNYSLEDLVKIDPEIIGSGLRWLHTREGWRKIAEIERMSNHNIHDIFKTIDMIESIEDKLVCAIDYHIELSGIPDKMNNGR